MNIPKEELRWQLLTPNSKRIVIAAAFISFIFLIFWLTQYRGPYAWYIESALNDSGQYNTSFAFIIATVSAYFTFILLILGLLHAGQLKFNGHNFTPHFSEIFGAIFDKNKLTYLREKRLRVIFMIVGAFFVLESLPNLALVLNSNSQIIETNIENFDKNQMTKNPWIELSAMAQPEHAVGFFEIGRTAGNDRREIYIPLNSEKNPGPIKIVLRMTPHYSSTAKNPLTEKDMAELAEGKFPGMIAPFRLSPQLRDMFLREGAVLEDRPLVLQWRKSPKVLFSESSTQLIFGLLCMALSGFVWFIMSRSNKTN